MAFLGPALAGIGSAGAGAGAGASALGSAGAGASALGSAGSAGSALGSAGGAGASAGGFGNIMGQIAPFLGGGGGGGNGSGSGEPEGKSAMGGPSGMIDKIKGIGEQFSPHQGDIGADMFMQALGKGPSVSVPMPNPAYAKSTAGTLVDGLVNRFGDEGFKKAYYGGEQ